MLNNEPLTVASKYELFQMVAGAVSKALPGIAVVALSNEQDNPAINVDGHDMSKIMERFSLSYDEYTNKNVVLYKHWTNSDSRDAVIADAIRVAHEIVGSHNGRLAQEKRIAQRDKFFAMMGNHARDSGHDWAGKSGAFVLNGTSVARFLELSLPEAVKVTDYNKNHRINKRFPARADGTFNVPKIMEALLVCVNYDKRMNAYYTAQQQSEKLADTLNDELGRNGSSLKYQSICATGTGDADKVIVRISKYWTVDQARELINYALAMLERDEPASNVVPLKGK